MQALLGNERLQIKGVWYGVGVSGGSKKAAA